MPPDLFLLRHGETEWNRQGRIQGSQDSPLTALGQKQALAQRHILTRELPQMWRLARYSSPLPRARETARIALDGLEPVIDPRLRELDCGAWEGLSPAARLARDPELAGSRASDFDLYRNAPGGEGLDSLKMRVGDFLADLKAPSIIVAHKVVLVVMRGLLTQRPHATWERIDAPQGVVIKVENGHETILR